MKALLNIFPLLSALVICTCGLAACPQLPDQEPDVTGEGESAVSDDQEIRDLEDAVFNAVNAVREENNLTPVTASEELRMIARAHSQDMADRNYFSHEDPEGHGLQYRLDMNGVSYRFAAENIACTTEPADPVPVIIQQWMESSVYSYNTLDLDGEAVWEYAGAGAGQCSDKIYVTLIFTLSSLPKNQPGNLTTDEALNLFLLCNYYNKSYF